MDLNKASMVIALTLFLTSVSFNIRPTIVQAQPPIMSTFKVEPSTSTGGVGETITLAVNVYDAQGLWGWQVYMTWDPTVLGFTALTIGDFLAGQPQGTAQYSMTDYASDGWFMCSEVSYGGDPGVTADSGWLVSVDFEVLASGKTNIDINSEYTYWQDSTLRTWGDDPEEMIKENGYFSPLATITYDAGENIITCTGGTEGSPITFWDLWNASDVNGWDVVWNNQENNTQYQFDCRIKIGDGSTTTWFTDYDKQIMWSANSISGNWQHLMECRGNVTFGVLDDATTKRTHGGCHFISLIQTYSYRFIYHAGSKLYVYSSVFNNVGTNQAVIFNYGTNIRYWNLILSKTNLSPAQPCDVYNVNIQKLGATDAAISLATIGATFDKISVTDVGRTVYASSIYGFTLSNLYARGCTYIVRPWGWSGTGYIINADSNTWSFLWGETCTGKVYRQYTFDLTVTYPNGTAIENANVTITHYGQAETEDYNGLTDSNGQIPQQTLSTGFYNQTGADTIYSYEPYNLKIANVTGYNDYDGNFTLSEQTDWTITLTPATSESGGATYFAPAFLLAFMICLVLGIVWIKK